MVLWTGLIRLGVVLMVKGYKYSQSLCVFLDDVVCPLHKRVSKDTRFESGFIAVECFKCPHYLRFVREEDEEDARIMDEIDRERAVFDAQTR